MRTIKSIAAITTLIVTIGIRLNAQTCTYAPYPKTFSGPVSTGANLVANGGFESGDFQNWFNDPNEDANMTAGAARTGSYGLRAYAGPFKFKTQQELVDLEPNQNYELKFWMRSYSGSPSVDVYLWYLDNSGAWQNHGSTYSPNSSWQEYTISFTTPALCANNYQIRIQIPRYQETGIHMDDIEIIATGNEFSAVNHPIPPVQTEVFFEDFDNAEGGTILNPDKWAVIKKQWSSGHAGPNHGVVPENLELTGNTILFKGHGDNYTGSVQGFGGNTRVGSVIATKDYYASGRYEVRAKLAPVGVCTAFWTYHYIEDEYNSSSPGTEIKNTEIDWEFPGDNNGPNSLQEARCNTWGGLCNGWTGEYSARGDLFQSPTVNNVNDLMNSYHTYRIDWHTGGGGETPRIEWYIDDVLVEYYDHDKISGDEDNVGFRATRFWIGVWYSSWSGLPDHDEVNCEVDWVRITPFNEPNDVYENETVPSDGLAPTCQYPLYPTVAPIAEFTSNTTNVCTGENITFTSTSSGTIDTYNWNFGSGATPSTASGPGPHTVSYTTAGNKNITLDVSGSGGSDSEVKNSFINVGESITPTISISQTTGSNPDCSGENLTYTASITNGGSNPTYQWKVNGSNVGTNSSTFSSTTLNDQDEISVDLTSSNSCASPSTVSSNSITQGIDSPPTTDITINIDSPPTCAGDAINFSSSVTGSPVTGYLWYLNSSSTGNTTDSYNSSSLVNGDQVYLEGSVNSCGSSQTFTSNTITVTGIQNTVTPTISISQTTGSNPDCAGENLTYTASITNGGISPTYQWKVNGSNVGTNSSTFSSTTLNDQDVISVDLTSSSSCASPTTASSNSITQLINDNPGLSSQLTISADYNPTCNDYPITFSSTVTGDPLNSLMWFKNNSSTGVTNSTYSSNGFNNGDQVYLEGYINGCIGTQTITSNTITTSTTTSPITSTISGSDVLPCNQTGESYTVDFHSGSEYNWNTTSGATIVSGQGTNSITVDFTTNDATISVSEFVTPTCISATEFKSVQLCVSSIEASENIILSIQPNPFESNCTISLSNDQYSYDYEIYTINGQLVEQKTNNNSTGTTIGSNLDSGIYILHIHNSEISLTERIVKY